MDEKKNQLLKITLVLFIIITMGYGVIYLFFPEFQIKMAGGEPISPGWIRWAGGVLLSLGVGSIMVYRNPAKQGIFITTITIGSLLVSLAFFYDLAFFWDPSYNNLVTLIPAIVLFIVSILLYVSIRASKDTLW